MWILLKSPLKSPLKNPLKSPLRSTFKVPLRSPLNIHCNICTYMCRIYTISIFVYLYLRIFENEIDKVDKIKVSLIFSSRDKILLCFRLRICSFINILRIHCQWLVVAGSKTDVINLEKTFAKIASPNQVEILLIVIFIIYCPHSHS